VLIDAFSIEGSVAYASAKILDNDNYPISIGKYWPRVPKWRASLQTTWRPATSWLVAVAVRHAGRSFNRLENDDIHPNTYGGVSKFTIADARIAYTFASDVELALGVDNITNERSYQSHPLGMRTGFIEARWSFKESP
jgi:iron complex outermembrane receptor protein